MKVERGLEFESADRETGKLGVSVTRNEILIPLKKPGYYIRVILEFQDDGLRLPERPRAYRGCNTSWAPWNCSSSVASYAA